MEAVAPRRRAVGRGRRRRPSFTQLRIADLCRLFRARYRGERLPDSEEGRDALEIIAHHLAVLPGNVADRVRSWAEMWAPWLSVRELSALTAEVTQRPRRWSADRLGWRLKLIDRDREALRITTIGSADLPAAERKKRRKMLARARDEARRRAKGQRPRAVYLADLRAKPRAPELWQAEGVSRATWFRLRSRAGPV